jgi:hypothetical protein
MKRIPCQTAVGIIWISAALVLTAVAILRTDERGYEAYSICLYLTLACQLAGFVQGLILAPRCPVLHALAGWSIAVLSPPTYNIITAWMLQRPLLLIVFPALAAVGFRNGAHYRDDRRIGHVVWIAGVALVIGGVMIGNEALFNCLPAHIWRRIVFAPRP